MASGSFAVAEPDGFADTDGADRRNRPDGVNGVSGPDRTDGRHGSIANDTSAQPPQG
jgi:hypothetical protein